MKKLIFGTLGVAVIATLLITSCKKDEQTKTVEQKKEVNVNPYDYIGQIHNQGMSALLNQCKEAKKSNSNIEMNAFVSNYMMNELRKANNTYSEPKIKNNLDLIISKVCLNKEIYLTTNRSDSSNIILDTLNLSAYQKSKIKSIFEVLNNSINVNESLKKIELDVLNSNENDNEKAIVLCALSISKYSYEFWNTNQQFLGRAVTVNNAAKADLGGAILGSAQSLASGAAAVGTLMLGPGGTVLTVGGAAVTGALWSSGFYLVTFGWF